MAEVVTGTACYVEPGAPPSSYAVAAFYEGDPSAPLQIALATAARAAFVLPGLWLAGVRGKQLVAGAALGATSITLALFLYYGLRRAGALAAWNSAAADDSL